MRDRRIEEKENIVMKYSPKTTNDSKYPPSSSLRPYISKWPIQYIFLTNIVDATGINAIKTINKWIITPLPAII